MSLLVERLSKTLQRELAMLLMKQAKDNNLSSVTVTEVRVTKDLSYATVYYTVPVFLKDKIEDSLNRSKGYLKSELSKKVQSRKMPELLFKYDEALEYGNHINEVLNNIK